MNIYKSLFIAGLFLIPLPILFLVIAIYAIVQGEFEAIIFFIAFFIALIVVIFFILEYKSAFKTSKPRSPEICLSVLLTWTIASLLSAIPIFISIKERFAISFIDAFFESISGITTTGATIVQDIELLPYSILLFRSMLQWLGGIWTVLFAVLAMPLLYSTSKIQIITTGSKVKISKKVISNIQECAIWSFNIYIILTIACACVYRFLGMTSFDAINHAMTTISTGGFSTHSTSIGYYQSSALELSSAVFMLIASMPFVSLIYIARDYDIKALMNIEIIVMIIIAIVSSMVIYLDGNNKYDISSTIFSTISLMTGTGFTSIDINNHSIDFVILSILMIIGGCGGSTTSGIKVYRINELFHYIIVYIKDIIGDEFNNKIRIIEQEEDNVYKRGIIALLIIYFISLLFIYGLLVLTGMDSLSSVSCAISAISNVGPAFGQATGGITEGFSALNQNAKIIMAFGMILGKVEFFVFIIVIYGFIQNIIGKSFKEKLQF